MTTYCFVHPFRNAKCCDGPSRSIPKVGCAVGRKMLRNTDLRQCDCQTVVPGTPVARDGSPGSPQVVSEERNIAKIVLNTDWMEKESYMSVLKLSCNFEYWYNFSPIHSQAFLGVGNFTKYGWWACAPTVHEVVHYCSKELTCIRSQNNVTTLHSSFVKSILYKNASRMVSFTKNLFFIYKFAFRHNSEYSLYFDTRTFDVSET